MPEIIEMQPFTPHAQNLIALTIVVSRENSLSFTSTPEAESDACGIAEIVLVGVAKLIGEIGEQIVDSRWPYRHRMPYRNVHASADRHRKGIV